LSSGAASFDEAYIYLSRALEAYPDFADAQYAFDVFSGEERVRQSSWLFEKALSLYPGKKDGIRCTGYGASSGGSTRIDILIKVMNEHSKNNISCAILVVCLSVIFLPCLRAGFVNLDDPLHILENPAVLNFSFHSIREIFSQNINKVFIPLTVLSYGLEHYLFGFNAFIFHLDNVILHAAVVLSIFYAGPTHGFIRQSGLLCRTYFRYSSQRVESVAWLTERKECAVFFALRSSPAPVLVLFKDRAIEVLCRHIDIGALSLLAKPMH